MDKNQTENIEVMSLEGPLTLPKAVSLKEEFRQKVKPGQKVKLNLEKITCIDLAGIQLLYSLGRSLEKEGSSLVLQGDCPHEIKRVMEEAGFSDTNWIYFEKSDGIPLGRKTC